MFPRELLPLAVGLIGLYVIVVALSYWWARRVRREIEAKEREIKHRLYEIAILKEISDRTGYSLNIQKILDVIAGSLRQFIEYSAASYMLLEPSKIIFKADLDQSVSPQFIKDIRGRMLGSLEALLGRPLADMQIEETLTGAIMLDDVDELVQSFFNIPLVIGGQLVGVLTIAHTKAGLYKEEEMAILYKIVNQASQAVTSLGEVVKTEQGKIIAMLESMVEGVVMTDRDYHIVAMNPSARAIVGYTPTGEPTMFDIVEKFKNIFNLQEKLEESIKLDKMITLDGAVLGDKYYQILLSPVKSNQGAMKGQVLGGVIIFHDITHEKEAEKMRSDFTSMMVHELRSPLGNIKKIGELMKSSKILEDKEASTEYAGMLYDSSSSMLDLVNDLLDVSKLEAGKFEVDRQPGNIKELLVERVKFFDTTARDASVALKISLGEGVPDVVSMDTKRTAQIVNNLLSNALKYTPKGGTVTAECFLHTQGTEIGAEALRFGMPWFAESAEKSTANLAKSVVVAVTDTGEGISLENVGKLWNKFTQFTSTARKGAEHKGTGLGLVIVKGIVEAHGGTVGVGSKLGSGSTFYFTLPLEVV
ncbi:MAG: hypothetical protein A2937_00140 [Candidatus Yonathbacteria bacterium RIFCSPLOWO2_01_FULL_47_33b]|uniref:histidine kinase n=1 Tax=Candidatus Yonathbacteria bacterium RIFCSPLOWO2_01_FULL_47_33b TaxID=1802727 RepID=A0A1G2SEU2_9BACT|nr:MAG: hypothetical protein A2937_00140 [Candidatus Yonathbacteria bacterium RIFCSPLOWO2_01_FULL_47_33b]